MQLFSRLWKQLEVCVLKNKYRSWLQWTSNFLSKTKKMFYFSLMSILFFSCHSNHSTPISFNYPDPNSKLYTICRQDLVSFDRNSPKEKLRRTEVVWCWTEELSPLWNNAQVPSQPCSSLISKRPCNLVHVIFEMGVLLTQTQNQGRWRIIWNWPLLSFYLRWVSGFIWLDMNNSLRVNCLSAKAVYPVL